MEFFLSFLGYLACLCTALVVIVTSVANLFSPLSANAALRHDIEVSAQQKRAHSPARIVTRQLAERAAKRDHPRPGHRTQR